MKKLLFVLMAALVGVAAWPQSSSSDEDTKRQLAGATGFFVVVDVSPDSLASLLPISSIQTDVELRLRIAHIPVLPVDQAGMTNGAIININVSGVRSSSGQVWAISLRAECYQLAQLTRDPRVGTLGLTWHQDIVVSSGKDSVPEVREDIKDSIDKLANLYLAANP